MADKKRFTTATLNLAPVTVKEGGVEEKVGADELLIDVQIEGEIPGFHSPQQMKIIKRSDLNAKQQKTFDAFVALVENLQKPE